MSQSSFQISFTDCYVNDAEKEWKGNGKSVCNHMWLLSKQMKNIKKIQQKTDLSSFLPFVFDDKKWTQTENSKHTLTLRKWGRNRRDDWWNMSHAISLANINLSVASVIGVIAMQTTLRILINLWDSSCAFPILVQKVQLHFTCIRSVRIMKIYHTKLARTPDLRPEKYWIEN